MVIYDGSDGVALVFDDGPNPNVTPEILRVLADKQAPGHFFLIGRRAEEYPEITKQIADGGHEIGNHSHSHRHLITLLADQGPEAVVHEIEASAAALAKATGLSSAQIALFRPPYLEWNDELAEIAKPFYGDQILMADLLINDWDWNPARLWPANNQQVISNHASKIVKVWKDYAQDGTIVAMHDSAELNIPGNKQNPNWMNRALPTLAALPDLIDSLRAKGLVIKTLSEMQLVTKPLRPRH